MAKPKKQVEPNKKAVGYIRVSTDLQAEEGSSLDAQEAKIRAAAVVEGLELVDVIIDAGESGKNIERPGMRRLAALVFSREIGYVIIPKLDRLSRKVRDVLELIELFEAHGVELLSLHEHLDTKTPIGRMVLTVVAAFAQMEREQTIERTKDVIAHRKAAGKVVGNVPYGYRDDGTGTLMKDAKEQRVLTYATAQRGHGLSYDRIANALNNAGHTTRSGTPWRKQYVHAILNEA